MAALGLHWSCSVVLILVTAMLQPETAYAILVSIYSYSIRILNGVFVSGGLIFVKLSASRNWAKSANFVPWLNPLHAVVYFVGCTFVFFGAFAKPSAGSPYSYEVSHIQWFVVPCIGLSTLVWGLVWWFGLHLVMLRKVKELVVTRVVVTVPDEELSGQYRQDSEVIYHEWHTKTSRRREEYEMS